MPGKGQQEADLGQFGGLEGDRTEPEPGLSAVDLDADDQHQAEQDNARGQQPGADGGQQLVIDGQRQQRGDHADDEPGRLALEVARGGGRVGADQGRGVDGGQADTGETEGRGDQRPVQPAPIQARGQPLHEPLSTRRADGRGDLRGPLLGRGPEQVVDAVGEVGVGPRGVDLVEDVDVR